MRQLVLYIHGTDIKITSAQLQRSKQCLNLILAENTGKIIEEICRDTERDNFTTATEAITVDKRPIGNYN